MSVQVRAGSRRQGATAAGHLCATARRHRSDRAVASATLAAARSSLVLLLVAAVLLGGLPPAPAAAVTPCSRGTLALTFDDGPHARYTAQVLDALARRRVSATFFQVGQNIARLPALTRRAHNEGHRVANHTYRHENLTRLSDAAIRDTLRRTNRAARNANAPTPTLVRPPYGATSTRVRSVIEGLGMRQVRWNIDPQDWRSGRSSSTITRLVLSNLRDGGNILLHDGVANAPDTIAALPGIIDGARARGYCFGNLDARGRVAPPVPRARISDAEVVEGPAGTSTRVELTVRLSEPTSRQVSVGFRTRDGTAVAGLDYRAHSGTLTFAVGQTTRRIVVRVLGDDLDEAHEKFRVVLGSPSGLTIGRGTGTVTIIDDDPKPRMRIADASVTEGAAGTTTTVDVPVRLSAPSGRTVTVDFATADGTATAGRDYVATSGTLTFAPGTTRRNVRVTVLGDALDEPDEAFVVHLRNPSRAKVTRGTATVTIVDDDPAPALSVADASVAEGAAGTTSTVTLPVRLSAASGRPVTVTVATADGTATAGRDYVALTTTLTFAPGERRKDITITVLGDDEHEGDETFQVLLSSPQHAVVGRGVATVTILDDDPPGEPASGTGVQRDEP